jgi:hypothetical protein
VSTDAGEDQCIPERAAPLSLLRRPKSRLKRQSFELPLAEENAPRIIDSLCYPPSLDQTGVIAGISATILGECSITRRQGAAQSGM